MDNKPEKLIDSIIEMPKFEPIIYEEEKIQRKESHIYLLKQILDLKELNFNYKLILAYIIKYNINPYKGCFYSNKIYQIISNRTEQTTSLILSSLLKQDFIYADKEERKICITKKLYDIIYENKENIWKDSIKIKDSILLDSSLNSAEKIVLAKVLGLYSQYKQCIISNEKLAKMLNITPTYVSKLISSLEEKKKISTEYSNSIRFWRDRRNITSYKEKITVVKEKPKKIFDDLFDNMNNIQ